MEYAQKTIIDFLSGKIDIVDFRRLYDEKPEINDFLQKIIDDLKNDLGRERHAYSVVIGERTHQSIGVVKFLTAPDTDLGLRYSSQFDSVRQCLTYERRMITHNVETTSGASSFYDELYAIYYQIDQSVPYDYKYCKSYGFALDVIPEYLAGGQSEIYIQKHIIPLFPETMKKTERKKAIKAKIKEAFKSVKGYPCWAQSSEWPMDSEGKPCTYLGKGKSEGDLRRYRFLDETTGEVITVEQFY